MSKDTIVHGSIVTPSVKLVGACTVLDSVLRGDITVNPRAVLQGVEVDGRGTFYGRVVVVPCSQSTVIDGDPSVYIGPGVKLGAGVALLGHGEIRGEMTISLSGVIGAYLESLGAQNDDDCPGCGYLPCMCDQQ